MPIRFQGLLNNYKTLSENAATYKQMIDSFPYDKLVDSVNGNGPSPEYIKKDLEEELKWGKRVLKKSERVVWWLRFVSLQLLFNRYIFDAEHYNPMETKLVKRLISNNFLWNEYITKIKMDARIALPRTKELLAHYMSIDYQPIQDFEFGWLTPEGLFNQLRVLEAEFIERRREEKRAVVQQDTDTVLIDFGDGWAWVNLNRAA